MTARLFVLVALLSQFVLAGTLPATIRPLAVGSDVWMRDNPTDTGTEPHANSNIWQSPDILVCNTPAPCATSQNPIVGGTSYIFVTLRNDGPRVQPPQTITGNLYVYYTASGGNAQWSTDWNLINSALNITLNPGEVRSVPVAWVNVPGPGHFCLLTRWISGSDPMAVPEGLNTVQNTRNNNNIAWRNVNSVPLQPGGSDVRPYRIRNVNDVAQGNDLVVNVPGGDTFLRQGGVVVDLGPDLFKQWQAAGGQGQGIALAGGTAIRIVGTPARIQNLTLPANGSAALKLQFNANPTAVPGTYLLDIVQFSPNARGERVDSGGVRYTVQIAP